MSTSRVPVSSLNSMEVFLDISICDGRHFHFTVKKEKMVELLALYICFSFLNTERFDARTICVTWHLLKYSPFFFLFCLVLIGGS